MALRPTTSLYEIDPQKGKRVTHFQVRLGRAVPKGGRGGQLPRLQPLRGREFAFRGVQICSEFVVLTPNKSTCPGRSFSTVRPCVSGEKKTFHSTTMITLDAYIQNASCRTIYYTVNRRNLDVTLSGFQTAFGVYKPNAIRRFLMLQPSGLLPLGHLDNCPKSERPKTGCKLFFGVSLLIVTRIQLSLGNQGSKIELSTIQIPSRPNMNLDFGLIQI